MNMVKQRQAGVAMFVTLIVLLIVSVLGLSALRMSISQSTVSLNTRLETMSFQAAESGIRGVLLEASGSNIASSTNVIGATLIMGKCAEDDLTCVVYRCVTQANAAVVGACTTSDSLDGAGTSRAESHTRWAGNFIASGYAVNLYQDFVFETASKGCILEDGACSDVYWSENVQEFKKIAPADPSANFD